jgi:hypothetical protein
MAKTDRRLRIAIWSGNNLPDMGDAAFISNTFDASSGREYYEALPEPWKTNRSEEQLLYGWLGSTNNRSRTAVGRATVQGVDDDRGTVAFKFLPEATRYEMPRRGR